MIELTDIPEQLLEIQLRSGRVAKLDLLLFAAVAQEQLHLQNLDADASELTSEQLKQLAAICNTALETTEEETLSTMHAVAIFQRSLPELEKMTELLKNV